MAHRSLAHAPQLDPILDAALVLSDGTAFVGRGLGAPGIATGELVFNTSMTGYQEILTDPSYAKQIVTFTAPHVGNCGCNDDDHESEIPKALGAVFRCDVTAASSWRAESNLDDWMRRYDLRGICRVDTRSITSVLRDRGAQKAVLAYTPGEAPNIDNLAAIADQWAGMDGLDLAVDVTVPEASTWQQQTWTIDGGYSTGNQDGPHVIVLDYGVKSNILRSLAQRGCKVTFMPCDTKASDIITRKPDGVLLANGPGDPAATARYAATEIKALIDKGLPVFGICLGHQMLGIALGADTEKMAFGHHGANHPVQDLDSGHVLITSQNHGFAVAADAIPNQMRITHRSLFDGTIQGIALEGRPVFSVQFHPEASPGPHDASYLFDRFVAQVKATPTTRDVA